MLKSTLLCALALLSGVFAEEKIEAACRPCVRPCLTHCPDSALIKAATFLVNNLCEAIDTDNLALIQTMVVPRSTKRYIISTPTGCVDSGQLPYLNATINFISMASCPNNPSVLSASVDDIGNVIIIAENTLVVNDIAIDVKTRYVFEPVDSSCALKLVDIFSRQVECI